MTPFERLLAVFALLGAIGFSTPGLASTDPANPHPPAEPPARIVAIPGNAQVRLAWAPVAGASGYRVFRGANGAWLSMPIATTARTSHTSVGLINGTTYSFTVAAYSKAGAGPLSRIVIGTPLAPPEGVAATSGARRD